MATEKTATLKWKEVYSLGALNAAVVISWIAYHEYQPVLMANLGITHLIDFMIVAKAIVLVTIPPLAGWLSDKLLARNGKYLIVFTVGIGATAMVFMVVATLIGTSHIMDVSNLVPFMIVVWLISMNLFISPANSMIEAFAPAKKLPIIMGFLFLITELLYALEPVVVGLVQFFGDTLTFVVGGLLIAVTGYIFHKVSSDEVLQRKAELLEHDRVKRQKMSAYVSIFFVGLFLGVGKAFLIELFPSHFANLFPDIGDYGDLISFILLGLCAITGFLISKQIAKRNLKNVILFSFIILLIGVIGIYTTTNLYLTIGAALIIATGFTTLNISGLPFAIQHLSVRHVTYGVGIYIGASEILTGLFEYLYQ